MHSLLQFVMRIAKKLWISMNDLITSTSNPAIKFIRKLRDKKFRQEQQLFFIEGVRIVGEAIANQWEIDEIVVSPELVSGDFATDLATSAVEHCRKILYVDAKVFQSISSKDGPKGLAAVVGQRWHPLSTVKTENGVWVAVDRIQDPGNLGTILRTMDAVKSKGLILIDDCTDPYDFAAVRGSMGAIFSCKLIKSSQAEFFEFVKFENLHVIGTSDSAPLDFRAAKYPHDLVLLMGSEREGLSEGLIKVCNQFVRIPMQGNSDSLNLAVATAICLFQVYNHHHPISEGI